LVKGTGGGCIHSGGQGVTGTDTGTGRVTGVFGCGQLHLLPPRESEKTTRQTQDTTVQVLRIDAIHCSTVASGTRTTVFGPGDLPFCDWFREYTNNTYTSTCRPWAPQVGRPKTNLHHQACKLSTVVAAGDALIQNKTIPVEPDTDTPQTQFPNTH